MKNSFHRWYQCLQGLISVKSRKTALGGNELSTVPALINTSSFYSNPTAQHPSTGTRTAASYDRIWRCVNMARQKLPRSHALPAHPARKSVLQVPAVEDQVETDRITFLEKTNNLDWRHRILLSKKTGEWTIWSAGTGLWPKRENPLFKDCAHFLIKPR